MTRKVNSIAANLTVIREDIRDALREKGVEPGRSFRDFAQNIRDIQQTVIVQPEETPAPVPAKLPWYRRIFQRNK